MLVLVTFASFEIYLPWKSLSCRRMFTHIAEVRMRKLNYFHIFSVHANVESIFVRSDNSLFLFSVSSEYSNVFIPLFQVKL